MSLYLKLGLHFKISTFGGADAYLINAYFGDSTIILNQVGGGASWTLDLREVR